MGLLAGAGIYGAIAYGITRRTSEIGLRMALGAQRRQVLHMIVREAALIPLCGILAGAPLAFLVSRVAETLLFRVGAGDPFWFEASDSVILAAAVIVAVLPAVRAMRIEPVAALRHE